MGAALLDSLDSLGREGKSDSLFEFGHVNTLLLEVGVGAVLAGRVKLGSTGPVGVASFHH